MFLLWFLLFFSVTVGRPSECAPGCPLQRGRPCRGCAGNVATLGSRGAHKFQPASLDVQVLWPALLGGLWNLQAFFYFIFGFDDRERERERNIDLLFYLFMHSLVASVFALTGDWTYSLGISGWLSNYELPSQDLGFLIAGPAVPPNPLHSTW